MLAAAAGPPGEQVGGFSQSYELPAESSAVFTLSGMMTVPVLPGGSLLSVSCTSLAGQGLPVEGAQWYVAQVATG